MSAHRFNEDWGAALQAGLFTLPDPAAGDTLRPVGRGFNIANVSATGDYILADSPRGTIFFITCDDTSVVTVKDEDGNTIGVFTGTSGTTGLLCLAGDADSWTAARLGASDVNASVDSILETLTTTQGSFSLPLTGWREVVSNDIAALATAGTTGSGGVLATDTTPALEYVNGDTSSSLRVRWAASNVDAIATQFVLPLDCDLTQDIKLLFFAQMSGTTNTPVLTIDSCFVGASVGTKVTDATSGITDTLDIYVATIAAADIPTNHNGAISVSVELTPGAHGTDVLDIFGAYVQYTKKLLTS